MTTRQSRTTLTRFLLAIASMLVMSSCVSRSLYRSPYHVRMVSALQMEGPCLASMMEAPAKGCTQWEPNVTSFPVFEPSRRLVFAGAGDDQLHVIDGDSGRPLAAIATKGRVITAVKFGFEKSLIYFGTDKGMLYCLDAYSFAPVFTVNLDSKVSNNLVVTNDMVIFTSAIGTIYAVDAKNGSVLWRTEQQLAKERLRLAHQSNILVIDNKEGAPTDLLVPHADGYISVVNVNTGKLQKRIELGVSQGNGFPDIVASMLVFRNQLWVASNDFGLFIIDLGSLQTREQIQQPGVLELVTDGEKVFAATADQLIAYGASGKLLWKSELSDIRTRVPRAGFPFNRFQQGSKRVFFGVPTKLLVDENYVVLSYSLGSIGVFEKSSGRLVQIVGHAVGFSGMEWSLPRGFVAISKRGILMKFQAD